MKTQTRGPGPPLRHGARRSTWAGLILVSILSMLMRYPTGSEHGVDGFTFHALAGVILSTGSMGWLVTPASYLGLAPFSYPPAVPIAIAAFSGVSTTNLQWSVAVYSLLLGLLVTWTSFLFGRALFGRDSLALVTSLLVSGAGGILAFTNWNLSTRGTFLAIVPLVLALLAQVLHSEKSGLDKRMTALGLVCLTLVFVHFFWLLFLPLMLAAFVLFKIARTEDRLLQHTKRERSRARVVILTHAVLAIVLLLALYRNITDLFTIGNFPGLDGGFIPDNIVTRVGIQYATQVGLIIVLLPAGIWALTRTVERRSRYVLSALAVGFLPITTDPIYGILVAVPVVVAISSGAFDRFLAQALLTSPRALWRPVLVGVLLAGFLVAPAVVTVPRPTTITCGQSANLDDHAYDAGLYLRFSNPGTNFSFAWDDPLNAARLEAVSGRPGVEPILSIGDYAYPWLAKRTRATFFIPDDLLSSIIIQQQVVSVNDWIPTASQQYPYFFGKHMFLLDNSAPGSPTARAITNAYGTEYAVQICSDSNSVYFQGLRQMSYQLYANEVQHIYFTGT